MILLHNVMYRLTYHLCTSNQASDHHELVWWVAGVGRMLAIEKGVLNEDDSFMHCKEEE
jgi:hypothetical protein